LNGPGPIAGPTARSDDDAHHGHRCRTVVVAGPGPRIAGHDAPAALIPILGRSPLQRHAVHLARNSVERFVVLLEPGGGTADLEDRCRRQLSEVSTGDMAVYVTRSTDPWLRRLDDGARPLLRVRAEGVYDPRLYTHMLEVDAPAWLADRTGPGPDDRSGDLRPVGMALAESPSEPGPKASAVLIDEIPPYLPSMRRTLRPYRCLVTTPDDLKRAGDMILDATQKGILDLPARYLHPPVENGLTRLFAPTGVTPNQITVVTGILGFVAAGLFATGRYGTGLAIAVLVNVLDGVDGKLARVKLLTSRFGDRLDHTLDVLFEFAWYLGIGYGLSGGSVAGTPFRLAVGLIALMLGNRAVSGIYKLVSGRQIHDHRAFDRAFRLVAGRRNIFVVILVVALPTGQISSAFTLCFWWAVLTLVVYLARTLVEVVVDVANVRDGAVRPP